MRKVLSLMLALILVLTSCMTMTFLVVSAEDATYGVLFNGLPSEGTTKTENGVNFEAKVDTAGQGSINNNNGIITMTTAGTYKAIDTKLTYGVNNTAEGKVKYSFYVATFDSVPSLYVKFYTGGTDTMCANFSLAANSSNTIVFEYDPASGSYVMTINGVTKQNGTVDLSKGIDSVYFRAMSSTGNREAVQLTNAKVEHIAPPMTGYGTYFNGLPENGETVANKNGVKVISPVAAENGKITLTPPNPATRLDTTVEFAANNTMDGIVTYYFDITTGSASPEFMFGINNLDLSGHRAFFEQHAAANTNYILEFKYNTQTAEYTLTMNGIDKTPASLYRPTATEGITNVTLASYKASSAAVVINKIKVVYDPFPMTGYGTYLSGIPASGLEKQENGAKFYVAYENQGKAENNGDAIEMTTAGGWGKAVLPTIEFDADDTLNGIVTYEFTVSVETKLPQALYIRLNDDTDNYNLNVASGSGDGYIPIFDGAANPTGLYHSMVLGETEYAFGIAYNTVTGDIAVTYAGYAATNSSYNTTIEGSTRKKIDPKTGLSKVALAVFSGSADSVNYLKDVKVSYHPFDNAEDIDVQYNQETKKASAVVSVTKSPYFSSFDKDATLYVAAYKGDELAVVGFTPVKFANGENQYTADVDLTNVAYDRLDAFLWTNDDLYPISSAK